MAAYEFCLTPKSVPEVRTLHRLIHTIPTAGATEILFRLKKSESRSMHGQLPLVWDKADDFSVYDIAGNRWIDFTSAIL